MSKQTRFIFERPLEAMISEMMDMGIRDFRVIDAMRRIPRHIFLDEALHSRATKTVRGQLVISKQFRNLSSSQR